MVELHPEVKIVQPCEEEQIKKLKEAFIKAIGGFQFLFIALSIGIISKYVTGWLWVNYLIDTCIIVFTLVIMLLKTKMDKKAYKEKRGET